MSPRLRGQDDSTAAECFLEYNAVSLLDFYFTVANYRVAESSAHGYTVVTIAVDDKGQSNNYKMFIKKLELITRGIRIMQKKSL